MIQNKNVFPEWNLSPQVLLDCDTADDGCHGGNTNRAYQYMQRIFLLFHHILSLTL